MVKIENVKVYNIAEAVYAARNAMNSWDRSDSDLGKDILGPNDLDLAKRLYKAGPEHAKYLRQIFVKFDLTATSFVFAEVDTYKVGTTRNSCSFQHKGTSEEFKLEFFDAEPIDDTNAVVWEKIIDELNRLRNLYLLTKNYEYFKAIRRILPSGWLIKATMTMSYANVMSIINQRQFHKLSEWHEICDEFRKMPYIKAIRGEE